VPPFFQNYDVPVYCEKTRARKDISYTYGKKSFHIRILAEQPAHTVFGNKRGVCCLLLDLKLMDMEGWGAVWIAGRGIYQRNMEKGLGLLQYGGGNDAGHKSVGNQALLVPLLLEQLV